MTTLTDFIVTDDVSDNLASKNNRFLGSMFSADNTNTESITATKELTDNDCIYQVITASGANRTVELPPEATTNHPHLIYNTSASNTVTVKDDSGATTFATLSADEWGLFFPVNGERWILSGVSDKIISHLTPTEITVASGVLTLTKAVHKVQPESGTSDDIDTITCTAGLYILYPSDAGTDTLTLKHNTGNISCLNSKDVSISQGGTIIYSNGTAVKVLSPTVKAGLLEGQGADLTIATGVITPTHKYHRVDTEAAAATDDLDSVVATNAVIGDTLILSSVNNARDVQLVDSTTLRMPASFTLDNAQDVVMLVCMSGVNTWAQISSASNA